MREIPVDISTLLKGLRAVIIERECEEVAQATNCPEIAIKVSIACVCVCLSLCKDAAADHANQQKCCEL